MNHRVLILILLSFGLLLGALITRNGNLAFMALPFLAYLGVGVLGAPARERIRLSATRLTEVDKTDRRAGAAAPAAGAVSSIQVQLTVQNDGDAISPLRLFDWLPPGAILTEGETQQWAALGSGEKANLHYTVQVDRGSFEWKNLHAVVSDPLCLFESSLELPASAEVLLQPTLKRFRPFPLRLDSTLHSPGIVPARMGGSGTDFWGVREYQPGDPLRRLDWRKTARHPRQFFTKELEKEEIADIGLILDKREGCDIKAGEDSLFEHTLGATASIAEMFLRQGNRVSLLLAGSQMSVVYPGYGKGQLNRILRSLAKARPGGRGSQLSLEHMLKRAFFGCTLIVILSPIASRDWSIFPQLRARGNQGLLISPDPIDFTRSSSALDPASLYALRVARLQRHLELRGIAHLGIRVIDWQVRQPLSPLVRGALRVASGLHR